MSKEIALHFRRFEFKYIIPRRVAERMIPELLSFMAWDPYVITNDYYEVNSLYYDSLSFKNYYEKLNGIRDRAKPRIRAYYKETEKNENFFFEIKRKYGDIIVKDRSAVAKKDYIDFMNDKFRSYRQLSALKDNDEMEDFLYLVERHQMRPVVLVAYKRKPLVGKKDPSFRVTFDYEIESAHPDGFKFEGNYRKVSGDFVVLEVKYNGTLPYWFYAIIEEYKLERGSYSKYCESIPVIYKMEEAEEAIEV